MDFTLTEQQKALQETARKFANNELIDIAKDMEINNIPPNKDLLKRYSELGFLGVNLETDYGGAGLSHFEAVLVLEEIAKVSIAIAFPIFESSFGPALAISHFAPQELRHRILPKVCAGETVIAVSMSEPDAGSALTDLTSKAEVQEKKVILNGKKRWCSGAGHADAYVVYCRMSDDLGAKGIGAVLLEKNTEGFSFGKNEVHMGFRGVPSADMYFDNVELPTQAPEPPIDAPL